MHPATFARLVALMGVSLTTSDMIKAAKAEPALSPMKREPHRYHFFERMGLMLGRRPPLPFGNCYPAPRRVHPKQGVPCAVQPTGELRRLIRRAALDRAEQEVRNRGGSLSAGRRERALYAAALRKGQSR